ncbi:MAG: GTP 3',8-cyclase MoaA, partial [Pseudomonadota bacterium]
IKINVVAIAGMNEAEVVDFARLTLDRPVSVRFIELMPVGRPLGSGPVTGVDTETVKRRIEESLGPLVPLARENGLDGPAERFTLSGASGEIGFITPVTGHPCPECNRMRLTADGKLRPCLLSDRELDARKVLRQGGTDEDLRALVAGAIAVKPASGPREKGVLSGCARVMHTIGG